MNSVTKNSMRRKKKRMSKREDKFNKKKTILRD
jgi:hypothetical protein